jgi:hypothetical protein
VLSLWMVTYFLASGLNLSYFLGTLDGSGGITEPSTNVDALCFAIA